MAERMTHLGLADYDEAIGRIDSFSAYLTSSEYITIASRRLQIAHSGVVNNLADTLNPHDYVLNREMHGEKRMRHVVALGAAAGLIIVQHSYESGAVPPAHCLPDMTLPAIGAERDAAADELVEQGGRAIQQLLGQTARKWVERQAEELVPMVFLQTFFHTAAGLVIDTAKTAYTAILEERTRKNAEQMQQFVGVTELEIDWDGALQELLSR
ncbi:MAG: hypothetical protein WBB39_01455 [Candidatus Saccharimonadales bacterium]